MSMLEEVEAVRYIKEMSSGRNRPWLIEAERLNGEVVEVVMKLGSAECGLGGLVREAYCAMLAADIDLPVAEPFIVQLTTEFVSTLSAERQALAVGQETAFGIAFVANMLPVQPGSPLPTFLLKQATEAFAFDAGIVNGDRLRTKPNCLTDGRTLLLIDHELALNLHGRGFLMQEPWSAGALVHMTSGASEHLFFREIRPNSPNSPPPNVAPICQLLANVVPSRVGDYQAAIPVGWDQDGISGQISAYLLELIENAGALRTELQAALS